MYTWDQIERGLSAPREVALELNAQYHWWRAGADHYPSGIDVMAQDWDYLVILDALRYDVMEERRDLPGELTSVTSRGSGTREWLRGNFRGRTFGDTVYINANPQPERLADELNMGFHDVVNVWEADWDESLGTVHPKSVRDRAVEVAEQYPRKRLLIHFVQPHDPFIGSTKDPSNSSGYLLSEDSEKEVGFLKGMYDSVRFNIDVKQWEKGYRENFEIVQQEVQELFDTLEGKFVVSSDHGVLLGERTSPIPARYLGHRIGCHHQKLLTVPWLEYESGERRTITEEESSRYQKQPDQQDVESRLADLGYVQ